MATIPGPIYPELIRSAWQAGLLENGKAREVPGQPLEEWDAGEDGDGGGWGGPIVR